MFMSPYDLGYAAYLCGEDFDDNPYDVEINEIENMQWSDGYCDANLDHGGRGSFSFE